MGWQMLPLVVLMSSFVGAVLGIGMIVLRGRDRNIPIPFGPYLAIAGWLCLLWGDQLVARYLAFAADRKSTRLNSSHVAISYAVFCLKNKRQQSAECAVAIVVP